MKQFILEKAANKGFNIAKFPKILENNKESSLETLNKKILYKDVSKKQTKEYCGTKISDLTGNYILFSIPKLKNQNTEKDVIKVTSIDNWYNFIVTEKIESNTLDIIEKNHNDLLKNLADINKIPVNAKQKKTKSDFEADVVKANLSNVKINKNSIPDPLKNIFLKDDDLELKELKELEKKTVEVKEKKEKNPTKKKKTKRNDDSLSERDSYIEEDLSFDGNADMKDIMLNNNKKVVYVTEIKDDFLNNDDEKNSIYSESAKSSDKDESGSSNYSDDYEEDISKNDGLLGNKRAKILQISLEDALNQIFCTKQKITKTKLLEELDNYNISMKEMQRFDDIMNRDYKSLKSSGDIIYIKKN